MPDVVSCRPCAGPYIDIDVVVDPHVDLDPGRERATPEAFIERVQALRSPFGDQSCQLFVIVGDPVIDAPGARVEDGDVWTRAFQGLRRMTDVEGEAGLMFVPGGPVAGRGEPGGLVSSLLEIRDPGHDDMPLGYAAVVGCLPMADPETTANQMDALRVLVRDMTNKFGSSAPLFVIAISRSEITCDCSEAHRGTSASVLLRGLQRSGVSLLVHHNAHRPGVATYTAIPNERYGHLRDLTLVRCPTFKAGTAWPGVTRLRIDARRGEAQIAFNLDLGSDRERPMPLQIVRPLVSASRVQAPERRLWATVKDLIKTGAEREGAEGSAQRLAFDEHVDSMWKEHGYVPLCRPHGEAIGLTATRHAQYFLLLLLREADDGSYDILLNRHVARQQSAIADWETLLMPAFTNTNELLENLRRDVARLVAERPEDLASVERAENLMRAVERILHRGGSGDVWGDQLRELARTAIRKVSPTTGLVTDFEYKLVILLPLVNRRARGDGLVPDESNDQEWADIQRVAEWLTRLHAVRADPLSPASVWLDAVGSEGSGLRWDPSSVLAEPTVTARRQACQVPLGGVWFPMDADGAPAWRRSPGITARNADVMEWVTGVVDGLLTEGRPPDWVVLGKAIPGSDSYEIDAWHRYDDSHRSAPPQAGVRSTVQALDLVTFEARSDLRGQHPYRGAELQRVYLVRRDMRVRGRDRPVILVYESGEEYNPEKARNSSIDDALGCLRPVQRYVLASGIERAKAIADQIHNQWLGPGRDPWGFITLHKGSVRKPVAFTPPIIERIADEECESEGLMEFVVCDGNHRVVHNIWRSRRVLPAVAVVSLPAQPYYALPFGRYEWHITSDRELQFSPDLASRYQARQVSNDDVTPQALAAYSKDERYRRYFRDLETGFGPMGGQGGRFT